MFGSSSFGPASKRRNSRSALQLIPLVVDSPLDKILRNRRPSIVQDAGSEPSSNFVERYDRLGSPDIEDKPVPGTSKKLPSPEPGFPAPLSREGSWSHPVRRLNLIAPEGSEALVTEQRRHSELYFGEANKKTERDKFKASRRLSVDCRRIVRRLTQRRASEDKKPKLPQWFSKTMKQVKSAGMDVCGLMPEWVRDREAEEELRMLTHSRLRWLASPEVGTTFVAGWLAVTWVALLRGHSPDPSAPPRLPTTAACNLLTACVAWAAQPRGEGVARDWGSALNALMQCSILLNLVTPLLLPAAPASSLWVLLAPLGALAFLYGEVAVPTSALYGLLLLVTCCASSLSSYSLPLPLALPLFNTSLTPPPEEDHGMAIAVLVAGAQMAIAAALVHAAHRMVHEVMRWRSLGALREKQLCQRESNRQLIASLLPPERSDALSKLAPSEWWRAPPDHFPECTFLQMDISGFTELSASITSLELFDLINAVFTSIDEATECIGHIWKVETVGDCYKACAGGFAPCEDHAERAVALGFAILGIVDNIATRLRLPLTVRCGIHTGPATGAFVGTQLPRYLMYGTTCEVAGLLETAAKTCHILCSPRTIASLSRPWDSELFLASLPDGGQLRAYSLALTDSNLHTLTSGPWGDPLKRLISIFGNNSSVFGSNSSILGGNPSIFSSNPSIFGSNPSVFSSPPPKLPPTPTSTPPRQLHRPPSLVLSDLGREPLVEEGGEGCTKAHQGFRLRKRAVRSLREMLDQFNQRWRVSPVSNKNLSLFPRSLASSHPPPPLGPCADPRSLLSLLRLLLCLLFSLLSGSLVRRRLQWAVASLAGALSPPLIIHSAAHTACHNHATRALDANETLGGGAGASGESMVWISGSTALLGFGWWLLADLLLRLQREQRDSRQVVEELEEAVEVQRSLLEALVPPMIATRLRTGETQIAETIPLAAVLFLYIPDFHDILQLHGPTATIAWVNQVQIRLDKCVTAWQGTPPSTRNSSPVAPSDPAPATPQEPPTSERSPKDKVSFGSSEEAPSLRRAGSLGRIGSIVGGGCEVTKVETFHNFFLAVAMARPEDDAEPEHAGGAGAGGGAGGRKSVGGNVGGNVGGHVGNTVLAAAQMVKEAWEVERPDGERTSLRVGICAGPICAGVVGVTAPRFSIFGDTVNTASRMASSAQRSEGGHVRLHVTAGTVEAMTGGDGQRVRARGLQLEPRGDGMEIKGKGVMHTWEIRDDAPLQAGSRNRLPMPEVFLPSSPTCVPQDPASIFLPNSPASGPGNFTSRALFLPSSPPQVPRSPTSRTANATPILSSDLASITHPTPPRPPPQVHAWRSSLTAARAEAEQRWAARGAGRGEERAEEGVGLAAECMGNVLMI